MTDTPAAILNAAADRIRDLAADTTRPRPNGHDWSVLGEEDGWEPGWSTVVSCAGYGGEDVVATDISVGNGRWISALSPALAPHFEKILRRAASDYVVFVAAWESRPRPEGEVARLVEQQFGGAMGLARAILGSGVEAL